MTNPFEQHGLDHLSPSSLNAYIEQPAYWVLKYLFKDQLQDDSNARMWRGSAVEAGVDHWLMTRDVGVALEAASRRFEEDAQGEVDDALICKERAAIPVMLMRAQEALDGYMKPLGRQIKLEHWFDGIDVPVLGYADYEWDDDGLDLKTTHRMPSQVSGGHGRQMALYSTARKKPYKLLYVTRYKISFMLVMPADVAYYIKQLEKAAKGVEKLLSLSTDRKEIASMFMPNLDHFYWKSDEAQAAASKVWEL